MKGNAKECSNYCTIALISHASKVMLKICQARLQQYLNRELPNIQAGFRKSRGTGDQIANIHWIIKKSIEKAKEFEKSTLKPLTVWITTNCVKFLKSWCREPVRHSTRDKGHEEGGSAYAKAGSSLRSPPGYSRASTPQKTRVCLLYCFVLSPLTLLGAVPYHHLSLSVKELTYSSN